MFFLGLGNATAQQCNIEITFTTIPSKWADQLSWNLLDKSGRYVLGGYFNDSQYTSAISYVYTYVAKDPPYRLLIDNTNDNYSDNSVNYSVKVGGSVVATGTVAATKKEIKTINLILPAACACSTPVCEVCPNGEDFTFRTQADLTNFKNSFSNCGNIKLGNVTIGQSYDGFPNPGTTSTYVTNITDISALENVSEVTGNLELMYNNKLTSLLSLSNLKKIKGSLRIHKNILLENLNGLHNVESINGELSLRFNAKLKNLNVFKATGLKTKLTLETNALLQYCNAPVVCNYLNTTEAFKISGNASNCISKTNILNTCSTSGAVVCPDNNTNLVFTTQAEIDNFAATYVGCNNITVNNLTIGRMDAILSDITSVVPLNSIIVIKGDLIIRNNPNLTSLEGLTKLKEAKSITIDNNSRLIHLDQLSNITTLNGGVNISNNSTLSNISGLSNIQPASIAGLTIANNVTLSVCNLPNFCQYLLGSGNRNIIGNKANCISEVTMKQACYPIVPDANSIIYVDTNVVGGTGNGSSWTNAIKELADALKYARTQNATTAYSSTKPLKIYVAKGTYKPLYNAGDGQFTTDGGRNNAFVMVNNVQLYGGFDPANGITALTHNRIIPDENTAAPNGTILSGDIGILGSDTDNAYHLVISSGAVGAGGLDGFTLTKGYANGTGSIAVNSYAIIQSYGGGVYNRDSSPFFNYIAISNNSAPDINNSMGGGMYSIGSSSKISNSSFVNNNALYGGGSYFVNSVNYSISHSSFTDNVAVSGGAGLYSDSSTSTVVNSYFLNNIASNGSTLGSGGGIQLSGTGAITVQNSLVANNKALGSNDDGGGGIMLYGGQMKASNLTLYNNTTSSVTKPDGNGISMMSGSVLDLSNSIVWGNVSKQINSLGTIDVKYSNVQNSSGVYIGVGNIIENPLFTNATTGDYSLQNSSPVIDKGSNPSYASNGGNLISDKDLAGKNRLSECAVDMGAYEYQSSDTYVNWDGTSWSNSSGPTQTLGACINNNYNLTNSFTTKNLKIINGSLNIKPNESVTVYGNISQVSDNGIVLENDANLIQINDNAINDTKKVTVKRNGHMRKMDYTYWGTPVSNQKLLNDTSINDGFSVGTPNNRIYNYNEPNDYFVGTTDQNFIPGKGYAIRGKDGFDANSLTAANYQFVGGINNGTYITTVQKSKNTILSGVKYEHGYNLIGNPYPSNIDFDKFFNLNTNSTKILGKVWFWTNVAPRLNQSGSGYNGNNYATLTLTGGSPPTTIQPNSGLTPTQFIKVGQGFIVQVRDATTTTSSTVSHQLDFNNSIRTDEAGIFYNAKNNSSDKDRFWLQLVSPQQFTNTILVGYVNGATNQYDGDYDAEVMSLGDDSVYTLLGSQKLQIEGRKYPLVIEDVIPLGVKYAEDGIYQLSLSTKEGIFNNSQFIYIKDKLLNKVIDITQEAYSFQAVKGTDENRFEIVYKTQDVLGADNNIKNHLIVYKDQREFVIKSNEILTKVQLFDMSGKLIDEVSQKSNEIRINHQSLINAAYILKIYKKDEIVNKKVIK